MITRILFSVLVMAMISSCTSMYKSGVTPDDVYYSPDVQQSVRDDDNGYRSSGSTDEGYVDLNDRYLRMKSSGGQRWSAFDDDFSYWNNPYWNNPFMFDRWGRTGMNWGMGMGMGSMWGSPFWGGSPMMGNSMFFSPFNSPYMGFNNHFMGGGFYNPMMMSYNSMWGNPFTPYYYGSPVVIINNNNFKVSAPRPGSTGPRIYNLGFYGGGNTDKGVMNQSSSGRPGVRVFNGNMGTEGRTNTRTVNGYMSTESSRPRGGYNSSENGGSRSSNPVRTFEPSGNSGGGSMRNSSSGGSTGGSAPVRSFPRGGN